MMGISGIHVLKDEYPQYVRTGKLMAADAFEADHDEEDVKSALERKTQDGSGFDSEDELPESDFESFSEEDVENNHDGDNEAAVEGSEDQ